MSCLGSRCSFTAALGVGLIVASCRAPQGSERPTSGRTAPEFSAKRLDRGTFQLSSLRGHVVVLDLWAAWCEGCEDELPALDDLAARVSGLGAKVVSVSLDEDPSKALAILRARSWKMLTLYDPSGRIGDAYAPTKLPTVFVIDNVGVIRDVRHALEPDDLAALEVRVRALAMPAEENQP